MTSQTYYLIDPFEKTISPVYYDGQLESVYALLDCRSITAVPCHGFDLFVDDEGLFVENQEFFLAVGCMQPLGGKALVVGCDAVGNTVPSGITLEQLESLVMFVEAVEWEDEE